MWQARGLLLQHWACAGSHAVLFLANGSFLGDPVAAVGALGACWLSPNPSSATWEVRDNPSPPKKVRPPVQFFAWVPGSFGPGFNLLGGSRSRSVPWLRGKLPGRWSALEL